MGGAAIIMATGSGIDITDDGRIAVLRMQCRDNRFTLEFVNNLNSALDEVKRNSSIIALVTTGSGKYYSNGLQLPLNDIDSRLIEAASTLLQRIATFPVPTIAAINGHAYGLGALLALSHDYRVMRRERGWFCVPAVHLKFPLPKPWMNLAKAKLPPAVHIPCVAMGMKYTGEEAQENGIVHKITCNADLLKTSLTLAREVTKNRSLDRKTLSTLKQDLLPLASKL